MDSKWKKLMTIFIIHGLLEAQAESASESDSSSSSGDCDNPTLTSMFKGQNRQKRAAPAPLRVTGCIDASPTITMECDPGSTINITKGICTKVPSCDAYDSSLKSQCDDADKTAQWAWYCETRNPCYISGTCKDGITCHGAYTYIYADYECVAGETTVSTTLTSGTPETTTEDPTPTPDFTTIHQALPTTPSQSHTVRQKSSHFNLIHQRWRLQNHVIKTKQGLSLVECGAECNKRDDCVSFNIGNGVCELNNQVVGGTDVGMNDFVREEGFKYYEKQ